MLIREYAFDHIDLLSTKMAVRIEISSWCPPHHGCVYGPEFRQGHDHQSIDHAAEPVRLMGADHNPLAVIGCDMPKLHKQGTPVFRKRCMAGARGIFQVGAGPVVSKLVAQISTEHKNLFPKPVLMQIELRTCSVSNDRGRACHLTTISLQKPAVDQGRRRWLPGQGVAIDDTALRQISVEQEGVHRKIVHSAYAKAA